MAGNWDFAVIGGLGIVAYLLLRRDVQNVIQYVPNKISEAIHTTKADALGNVFEFKNWLTQTISGIWGKFSA